MFDVPGVRLYLAGRSISLTKKAFALIGLLTLRRLQEHVPTRSGAPLPHRSGGWVTPQEIATLSEWSGDRTVTSLRSQIRREIQRLVDAGFDVIEAETRHLLKGPFRLKMFPSRNASDGNLLAKRFEPGVTAKTLTPEDLFLWIEESKPVWQSVYRFDKPTLPGSQEPVLLADSLESPAPDETRHPIVATIAFIDRARRQRDLGDFKVAIDSIRAALKAVQVETESSIARVHLEASCHLHLGWINYRWGRFNDAEKNAATALKILGGQGHLKVAAQILSLRSILRRIRKRYADALQDLQRAAEYWFIEGDLYNLFSVYHNLSTLVSAQADDETDVERRTELLHLAVKYCERSDRYCRNYKLGQNSIGSIIRLVSLYTRIGDFGRAKDRADVAFKEAKKKENIAEAALAHGHRVRLLLWKKDFAEAERLQAAFLKLVKEPSLRSIVDEGYREMLRQAREQPGCLPATSRIV